MTRAYPALVALSFACMMILGVPFPSAHAASALTNGGFESGDLQGWTQWGDASCSISMAPGLSGSSWSARLGDSSSGASCGIFQTVEIAPGSIYEVRATVHVDAGTPQLYLRWVNEAGADVGKFPLDTAIRQGPGVLLAAGMAPQGASAVRIWLYSTTADVGAARFDDVKLDRVGGNALSNAGFEDGLASWSAATEGPCTIDLDDDRLIDQVFTTSFYASPYATCSITQSVPVTPDTTYAAALSARSNTTNAPLISVRFVDTLGNEVWAGVSRGSAGGGVYGVLLLAPAPETAVNAIVTISTPISAQYARYTVDSVGFFLPIHDDCGMFGDAGNERGYAAPISNMTYRCRGLVGVDGDGRDWYATSTTLQPESYGYRKLVISASTDDVEVCLYPAAGVDNWVCETGVIQINVDSPALGSPYRFFVRPVDPAQPAAYFLTVGISRTGDCGYGLGDAPDNAQNPWHLDIPVICGGSVKGDLEFDYYRLNLTEKAGRPVRVEAWADASACLAYGALVLNSYHPSFSDTRCDGNGGEHTLTAPTDHDVWLMGLEYPYHNVENDYVLILHALSD